MTSRFERRLARIEKLQRPAPEPPPDPRGFVLATLVGFHCCNRSEDEHPLQAYVAAAKGPDGEAGMEHLFDGFLAAHSINIEADPTSDAVEAMQRLLDGVPERWRDADLAWWPNSAIDMWTEPKPQRSTSDRGAARIQHSSLLSTMEALPALSITLRSEYPVSAGNPLCAI